MKVKSNNSEQYFRFLTVREWRNEGKRDISKGNQLKMEREGKAGVVGIF